VVSGPPAHRPRRCSRRTGNAGDSVNGDDDARTCSSSLSSSSYGCCNADIAGGAARGCRKVNSSEPGGGAKLPIGGSNAGPCNCSCGGGVSRRRVGAGGSNGLRA
jgi:hypothetical protein